jgi:hypothetical protein
MSVVYGTLNIERKVTKMLIIDKVDPNNISWGELSMLTHKTQVQLFGWCACEDNEGNENPFEDCTGGTHND